MGPSGNRRQMRQSSNAKMNILKGCSNSNWWSKFLKLSFMIIFYFVASISLTFYQKELIVHIPLPISIVVFHLIVKFCFASVCRNLSTCITGNARVVLQWKQYVIHVAPVALFSALDIGLSQWSFEFITISLYTMTKTTSIIFILMFAILLKLEEKHWSQIVIVLFISVGLYLFTYRATSFDAVGFTLAFSASFLSGARWTVSQKVLQKSKLNLQNPIDFIFHIQPFMILSILPLAIYVEGSRMVASEFGFRFGGPAEALSNVVKIGFGGVMAFFMEVAEFLIITHASSLTLSIIGVVKEVMILTLSIAVKGNHVSSINIAGMVICLFGLAAHVTYKGLEECKKSKNINRVNNFDLDSDSEFEISSSRQSSINQFKKSGFDSMPLLNDELDSSSDGEDLRINPNLSLSRLADSRRHRPVDDDFYLNDQRQWTAVRDAHIEMKPIALK